MGVLTKRWVGQQLQGVPRAAIEGEAEGVRRALNSGHKVGVPIHCGGGVGGVTWDLLTPLVLPPYPLSPYLRQKR